MTDYNIKKEHPSNKDRGALYLEKQYNEQSTKNKREIACRLLLAGMRHRAKMAQLKGVLKFNCNRVYEECMEEI